jgi:hypothetical protein
MPRRTESRERAGDEVLGPHPPSPDPFAEVLSATDSWTESRVAHRALSERHNERASSITWLRDILVRHHTNPQQLERSERQREAMIRLGFGAQQARLRRFPTLENTQKGNLAEIVLAEYIEAVTGTTVPIYRLRYNPNVDQSMKGNDVLAFDLDSDPVRIIVGESKFRGTSSKAAVEEIAADLVRSHKAGIPVSLQFVADRLFEDGRTDLAMRVEQCAELFASGRLRLDYVGLFLSDVHAIERVHSGTPRPFARLAMISLGVSDPDSLVRDCYEGLD